MRFLIFFLLAVELLGFDLTVVTENEPSSLVEGVSVITGDFCMRNHICTVQGAEPIHLNSTYVSEGVFLTGYEYCKAKFKWLSRFVSIQESYGTQIDYFLEDSDKKQKYKKKKEKATAHVYTPDRFIRQSLGISNTASGTISAQTHLKNHRLILHFDPKKDPTSYHFVFHASDGTIRHYGRGKGRGKTEIPNPGVVKNDTFYKTYEYFLRQEELPNGHVLHYMWNNGQLSEIRSTNKSGKKVFASMRIDKKSPEFQEYIGSDDQKASFHSTFSQELKSLVLQKIVSPHQLDLSFDWTAKQITTDGKPQEKGYMSSFSLGKEKTFHIYYDPSDQYAKPKVSHLQAPVGKDATPLTIHRFIYGDHKTDVFDVDGNKTSYYWNDEGRLTAIERFIGDSSFHSKECFVWNDTLLVSKSFWDTEGVCKYVRSFEYDPHGNVSHDYFSGNLTGKGGPIYQNPNGSVDQSRTETCVTLTNYSEDGKHLPIRVEDPTGLVTLYTYVPGTNLVKTKVLCDRHIPKITHTYDYDEDFLLIQETIEDGISKNIKRIFPKQTGPFLGMPEVIEERYGAQEKLLKKRILFYRAGAKIEREDVYDANDHFCYSLFYKYDEKNRLIWETNALGQVALTKYDASGNRSFYQDFASLVAETFEYDFSGRLVKKTCKAPEEERICEYRYDTKHNLEWESDERGHKTYYKYNLLGQRIETILPPFQTETGKLITPIIRQEYDAAGHEIARIDAEGHRTETKYNAYGKRVHVIHPNGLEEHFVYTVTGDLISHTDAMGVEIRYTYDYLGHIVEKGIFSQGKELSKETYCYVGHHLMSKTDAEGNVTLYTYDKAGRKISETFAGETTLFEYDALGRIFRSQQRAEITTRTFDLLDRILEEEHHSLSGKLLKKTRYEYDFAGNKTATIFFTENGASKEASVYDALNRVIEKTNAEGFKEKFTYKDVLNEQGQKVLQKTHTDALGLQTIETFNTHGHISTIEKRKNKTLTLTEKFYTPKGQVALQRDTIFTPEGSTRNSCIRWEYDAMGREIKLIEAADTLHAKITRKTYTPRGELEKLTKPNGVEVFYKYNDLNQLISIQSSDRTVNHHMSYNRLGHLQASDHLTRVTDPKGRVLREIFPAGHKIQNTFDSAGRRISCIIPDADCLIEYAYEGQNLSLVSRKTLDGQELYSHRYLKRDLSRHLLEEQLIGDQGLVEHSFDRLSRRFKVKARHFSQQILSFDPVGNILSTELQKQTIDYAYDDLYQLTKETGLFAHEFSYDLMYNRLTKDTEAFEINVLNQVVSHLEYNPNSCPTSQGSTKYFYDALDRLIQIATPTFIQLFGYDSFHRCLYKVVLQESGEKTLYFLYDGQKEIGSFDAAQKISELRILGSTPESEKGTAIAVELEEKVFAPLHDLQGNLTALIPIDGTAPSFYRYSAFGEEKIYGPTLSPWRFSSKRSDAETKLVYYGRRFYMPGLGRWLTPDPAGFTDGMNLYDFVHNEPLLHFDE